ncbi:AMIN domain-containing protein [Helicobacter sp. 11S03491-1]|uniref:AMIN domain-containing protein n=1 Tax=Helicobacter sp. 11S03491-1 TaxID=1476196 RepID=UPI000BA63276|nr:AMIN domain-containing protein [Helicobacter sp. 11S03491-1]PAF42666.1 hypothetical protein BKH45_03915 [Helicobacter sp. 11S03491-1]
MKKIFIFLCLFLYISVGRENPFEPLLTPKESSHDSSKNSKNYFENFDFKLPTTARILKSITVTYENIDGSINQKTLDIDESIDWHYPLRLSQKSAIVSETTSYYTISPFEFFIKGNKLYIHTAAKIQRNFLLPNPYRIVIDVDRKDPSINKNIEINKKYFTKISIGTHNAFYRIVITLDGQYRYEVNRENQYYVLSVQ